MRKHGRKLTAGWIIVFFCGFFGTMNGLVSYGSSLLSIMDPARPWSTGAGLTHLTLGQLRQWSPELGPYRVLVNMVAWVNLTFTGIMLTSAALFGLRKAQKWGWWVAFLVWFWVGLNDSVGVIAVYKMTGNFIPTAPIPSILGLIGLMLSFPAVFRGNETAGSYHVDGDNRGK